MKEKIHIHAYMVSKNLSVSLSVCLSVTNFDPNYDLLSNQNQKPFEKMFATLAARAVFVRQFLLKNS